MCITAGINRRRFPKGLGILRVTSITKLPALSRLWERTGISEIFTSAFLSGKSDQAFPEALVSMEFIEGG